MMAANTSREDHQRILKPDTSDALLEQRRQEVMTQARALGTQGPEQLKQGVTIQLPERPLPDQLVNR